MSDSGEIRGDRMPVSKKQLEELNKVKKAKAEDLAKQAAGGSESAKKKLKKLQKKIKRLLPGLEDRGFYGFDTDRL